MPYSSMNNTKWDELRLAMDQIDPTPRWSTLCDNGYRSPPDREWINHFRVGGYKDILHVDILADNLEHRELIRLALKEIHIAGEETEEGFRIYGYVQDGQTVDFI